MTIVCFFTFFLHCPGVNVWLVRSVMFNVNVLVLVNVHVNVFGITS